MTKPCYLFLFVLIIGAIGCNKANKLSEIPNNIDALSATYENIWELYNLPDSCFNIPIKCNCDDIEFNYIYHYNDSVMTKKYIIDYNIDADKNRKNIYLQTLIDGYNYIVVIKLNPEYFGIIPIACCYIKWRSTSTKCDIVNSDTVITNINPQTLKQILKNYSGAIINYKPKRIKLEIEEHKYDNRLFTFEKKYITQSMYDSLEKELDKKYLYEYYKQKFNEK